MKCPNCENDLHASDLGEYGFVVLDVCPQCQGAWFDKGELDKLDDSVWQNIEAADYTTATGERAERSCPKCETRLEPLSPKDDPALVLDHCPKCSGFWLDAGELDEVRRLSAHRDQAEMANVEPLKRPQGWSYARWLAHNYVEYYSRLRARRAG